MSKKLRTLCECAENGIFVGDGVLDIPTAARRQFGMSRKMLRIFRRGVEDAAPYG